MITLDDECNGAISSSHRDAQRRAHAKRRCVAMTVETVLSRRPSELALDNESRSFLDSAWSDDAKYIQTVCLSRDNLRDTAIEKMCGNGRKERVLGM